MRSHRVFTTIVYTFIVESDSLSLAKCFTTMLSLLWKVTHSRSSCFLLLSQEGSGVIVMFPALMCNDRVKVKALVLCEKYDIRS